MRETFSARAFRGMAYLDQHKPGWVDLIDTELLDMRSPDRCILGQLFGSYWNYCIYNGDFWKNVPDHHEVHDYGFQIAEDDYKFIRNPYPELSEIWVALINDRKGV